MLSQKDLIQYKGLWHSVKSEHIESILNKNQLESRTTQRWWEDGKVFKDNEGDVYQNSFFMKGWSTTRDKNYGFSWSCVTLLLDYELLKRDFKIVPISWNSRCASATQNFKKEREEFIVSNYMHQSIKDIEKEFMDITDDIYDNQGREALEKWLADNGDGYIDYWQRKGLKNIDLTKYLKGIFISKESFDIHSGKGFESVVNHPLFKGFVSSDCARKRHENSMQQFKYKLNAI